MESPNSFGEWLRRQRRACDLTQDELAKRAGCATGTIRKIEADELRPSKQLAEILAQCLNVPSQDRENLVRWARGILREPAPPLPITETASVPPPQRETKPAHNLPTQLTSFIGREKEIAEIERLLGETHLLTLIGAGGCGKTRLALQVARDLIGLRASDLSGLEFPDGVWFVDLAPPSDPALVPQVIASVFGLRQVSDMPINVLLQNFFRTRTLLLVLDNCEHLIQACAQLCDSLLRACSNLKILATSREALNIAGETVLRVPSLSLPDRNQSSSIEHLKQSESVRLFVERTRSARSDFQSNDANTRAIAQVCQRLDGIPLAIELAAARVNSISVEEIAVRLNDRFRLLTSGSRTALPRYQTLRASIDWSYDLLSDAERALFRRLGVFVGGFTLDAVESVCAEENKSEVLDLLSQLVQKSLVVSEPSGKSRYRLLETIREYALLKLRDAGETDWYRARHLDYFLKLAEEIAPRRRWGAQLRWADQLGWLDRMEMEHDNFRAAFRWVEETDNGEAALRLADALDPFWFVRGFFTEARGRWDAILALPSTNEPRVLPLRARALLSAGEHALIQTDYAVAGRLRQAGLGICRTLGDRTGMARALWASGVEAFATGDYARARSIHAECLAIFRELGDEDMAGETLMQLGVATREAGDYQAGRRLLEEVLASFREVGDQQTIALALMNIGATATAQGDPAARSILEEGLAIFRELGDKRGAGRCLHDLGQAAAWQGDYQFARACFEESLALLREVGDRRNLVKCVEGLAGIAVVNGQMERAARLFGASEAVREKLGTPLPTSYCANYERTIAALASQVDEEQMEKWWADGRTMTMEQAADYAVENLNSNGTRRITRAR